MKYSEFREGKLKKAAAPIVRREEAKDEARAATRADGFFLAGRFSNDSHQRV